MRVLNRRGMLAIAGTLAVASHAGKSPAAERHPEFTAAGGLPPAALTVLRQPSLAPDITFLQADGTERRLSEFRGHGMVLNFWATWCAPCVAEMPALAVLSAALAPHDIAVMPLSSDRGGAAVVRRFYDTQKIAALPILLDPKGEAGRKFAVRGIPVTLIIDKQGRLCARMEGAADWSSRAIAAQIRGLVG